MLKQASNMRWTVAVFTAVCLHGLLPWCFISSMRSAQIHQPVMELSFVAKQVKTEATPHPSKKTERLVHPVKKQAVQQKIQKKHATHATPVTSKQRVIDHETTSSFHIKQNDMMPAKITPKYQQTSNQDTLHGIHPHTKKTSIAHPAVQGIHTVPKALQGRIFMNTHYPKQAQRHGWQGKVIWQFEIQGQTIQKMILSTSSGYPILDRSAYRGLATVHHLALPNGIYRMPIVFRLQ